MTATASVDDEIKLLEKVFSHEEFQNAPETITLPDFWPIAPDYEEGEVFAKILTAGHWDRSHPFFASSMPSDMHNVQEDLFSLREVFDDERIVGGPSVEEKLAWRFALSESTLKQNDLFALVYKNPNLGGLVCFERTDDPHVREVRAILVYIPCDTHHTKYRLFYNDLAVLKPPVFHSPIVQASLGPESGYVPILLLGAMFYRAFSQMASAWTIYNAGKPTVAIDITAKNHEALNCFGDIYHYQPCPEGPVLSPRFW